MRILHIQGDKSAGDHFSQLSQAHDVHCVRGLAGAELELDRHDWRPDLVLADIELSSGRNLDTLDRLGRIVRTAPVVIGATGAVDVLQHELGVRRHLAEDQRDGHAMLQAMLHQQLILQHTMTGQRSQMMGELERLADQAAERAVAKGLDALMRRLGLEDTEGVRLAVRFARGWEAAKGRFLSALATGIASAMLLALGAGFIAMMRSAPEN